MLKLIYHLKAFCLLFSLIHFSSFSVIGQEYGLEFLGHEVVTDKRTALIIGKEQPICVKNDFELSFELKFKPKVQSYFGYVFRMITTDGQNLDLLFQSVSREKQQAFRIISGDEDIKLKTLNTTSFYAKWNKFRVVIQDKKIEVFDDNQLLGSGIISSKIKGCFKIYFGECSDPKFLTSDALPMYLRNITLKSDQQIRHHWPLREISGAYTSDIFDSQQKAFTKNAHWLLKKHYEWKQLEKVKVKGNSSFAFDANQRRIIINTDLKTYFFNTQNDSLSSKTLGKSHKKFTFGDMSIFLPSQNKLINLRLNEKKIFNYNTSQNSWDISADEKYDLTEYWHHNKYLYPTDSAIVLIGGYGQYKYKNSFQKYSFQNSIWSDLRLKGDIITPRYMFGLGTKNGTKSYLFGGFGSKTGDQGLNPQNYYDMFEIDWTTNTIKKLYDLKAPETPFVVASSLILNDKNDTFYGLIYNQLKFNSSLQLVEGSLSKPEIKPISKEIPYQFIDVGSNADIYFDKNNSKLFCVTSLHDRIPVDSTEIIIYSLDFPPSNLPTEVASNKVSFNQYFGKNIYIIIPLLLLGGLGYYFLRKRKSMPKPLSPALKTEANLVGNLVNEQITILPVNEETTIKGKVLLFGGFQFINEKGVDLTSMFTPLLKEMFLHILLHSVRWNKGINSQQLNELLWFDKTADSARNNRSVNITKLKTIFEQLPSISIGKDTGNWMITFDAKKVSLDYFDFLKLTNSKKEINSEQIGRLTEIINRGGFLTNLEYEWLDDFKGEISNKVIDTFLAYSKQLDVSKNAEEIIEIADNIFKFDSVDETAMSMKCRALVQLGKHSLAKASYEKFAKDYKRLYSEDYGVPYKEVLGA
ncbi:MAG: hypothetical protein U5M51_13605 [Emticicia sp.]|nr:hypothetical protein [Emticicia sp.]